MKQILIFTIGIYTVHIYLLEDKIVVTSRQYGLETEELVPGLGTFLASAKNLQVRFGSSENYDVIFLFDEADGCWGYACNIQDAVLSEWAHMPFEYAQF